MKIERLDAIERIPLAIEYRRVYRADAHVAVGDSSSTEAKIEFALEMSPYGGYDVSVRFLDNTDYPVIPAIKLLKEHIKTLDRTGRLP